MSTAVTTIFEYERQIIDGLTEHDMQSLERLNTDAGANILRPIFHKGHKAIQANQYVGIVRFGKHTVQVLPKIYDIKAPADDHPKAATRNLLHLLSQADQFPNHEHEITPLLKRGFDWFEILTALFVSHLTTELQRGPSRNYQTIDDELQSLKGKWRLTIQLRRPERKQVFAVSYDDFTIDNTLNRVFRFVVERLWHLTRVAQSRPRLGNLRQWLEDVTLLPSVTAQTASPALITRLNQRFESMLNLACLFLEHSTLQLSGGDQSSFAFTFDMNTLFEVFIARFISRYRDHILPADLARCDLMPQSRTVQRYLAKRDAANVFLLRPDLAFTSNGVFPLIVDTKYKRLDPADTKLGVSSADFYQMFAYAHRYNCRSVLLLYPQPDPDGSPLRTSFTISDTNFTIRIATVNLFTSLPEGYPALRKELNEILGGPYAHQ